MKKTVDLTKESDSDGKKLRENSREHRKRAAHSDASSGAAKKERKENIVVVRTQEFFSDETISD